MYYLVDNDEDIRFDDVSDVLDYCVNSEYYEDDADSFNDWLDQEGTIEVSGYEFNPSEVLHDMNYDGYRRELRCWAEDRAESEREDAVYDLEHTAPGGECWICGYRVYVYDDNEEEDEEDNSEHEHIFDFARLEEKLQQQKQEELNVSREEEKTADDFLSVLGIQVI